MTITMNVKLYMHTKVARHFETNPNMHKFVQILLQSWIHKLIAHKLHYGQILS